MASLKEGEWFTQVVSLIENGHVTEVVTLMEGEWSCYRSGRLKGGGGQFQGERMVVTEVARGRIVILQRWSV